MGWEYLVVLFYFVYILFYLFLKSCNEKHQEVASFKIQRLVNIWTHSKHNA